MRPISPYVIIGIIDAMDHGKAPETRIQGVAFDAVGTLIEPLDDVAEVYASAAARQGAAIDPSQVRGRFSKVFREVDLRGSRREWITSQSIEYERWRAIVTEVLAEAPFPGRAFSELWEYYAQPAAWRCLPGVAEALAFLGERGARVCVGSNFDSRLRKVVKGLPELAPLERRLVISSEVGRQKPHPRFYEAACEFLGLAPSTVLWIGDHPGNDFDGPRASGLKAALVGRRGHGAPSLSEILEVHLTPGEDGSSSAS